MFLRAITVADLSELARGVNATMSVVGERAVVRVLQCKVLRYSSPQYLDLVPAELDPDPIHMSLARQRVSAKSEPRELKN